MKVTWLFDGRLAASGYILPEDFDRVGSAGLTGIVTLTLRNPFPNGSPDGIHHLHLPIPDMSCPSQSDLDRAVRFIGREIDAGGRVLVHCGAGLGRTGTVIASFLVARGRSAEQAIHEVREARPGSVETHEQERGVMEFDMRQRGKLR